MAVAIFRFVCVQDNSHWREISTRCCVLPPDVTLRAISCSRSVSSPLQACHQRQHCLQTQSECHITSQKLTRVLLTASSCPSRLSSVMADAEKLWPTSRNVGRPPCDGHTNTIIIAQHQEGRMVECPTAGWLEEWCGTGKGASVCVYVTLC